MADKAKPPIDPDERETFQQSLRDIRPIKSTRRVRDHKKKPLAKKRRLPNDIDESLKPFSPLETLADEQWVSGGDRLEFSRTGLQHRLLQQLRRGTLPIEATLDLHRHTVNQALTATAQFLSLCQSKNLRVVRIVHGKGGDDQRSRPAIKNALNQWLPQQPCVLAFYSSTARQGGTGAMTILLKKTGTLIE